MQSETTSLRFNRFSIDPITFRSKASPYAALGEWIYRGKPNHIIRFGGLGWVQDFSQLIDITRKPNAEFEFPVTTNVLIQGKGRVYYSSAYAEDEWTLIPKKLSLLSGLRIDKVLNKGLNNLQTFQPRATLYIGDKDLETYSLSIGRYQQMDFRIWDSKLINLKPNEAIHYTAGYEKKYPKWMYRVEVYLKDYKNLTNDLFDNSGNLLGYDNSKSGTSHGLELFLQRKNTEKWSGSVSYTYSRVKYQNDFYDSHYPDHDQRHTLNLLGEYKLNTNWSLIAKGIWHTGKPYTDIENRTYSDSLKQYLPVLGKYNRSRYPIYTSLDIIMKYTKEKWLFKKYDAELYAGVSNVLNNNNVLGYDWDNDFTEKNPVNDVPRLPVFGLKITF